ncbi:MAG: tetratricopeptide repeat protein [Burkholderiales bacterium]|nr:tetratricopeptide repeat protein [Burkholderiales bacterium]
MKHGPEANGSKANGPNSHGPGSRGPALHVALLLTLTLVVYVPALQAGFQFDDFNVIVDNAQVHALRAWWESMPGIRALLKLSYTLNWKLSAHPAGFHAFNIAVHALNAALVLALVRRLAVTLAPASASAVPLLAALAFALHPAQTEAVTYVSGRSVSLMGTFYLGALLLHLDGAARTGPEITARLASPALFALALATRETAWTLPLAIALVQAVTQPGASPWRATRAHWLVLSAAGLAALAIPGYRRLLDGSISARSLWDNLLTQIDGVWYLICVPLLSLRTNIDPDLAVRTVADPLLLLRGAALLGLVAAAFALLRRHAWLGFGLLWFFLHLLPTNSVLPRLDVANDRHLYLALLGPAIIAAAALARLPAGHPRRGAAAGLVAALAVTSSLRNLDYRSEQALWSVTARTSPHKARVWNNLGYAHALAGDTRAAHAAYARALQLNPAHAKAAANLRALDAAPPSR